MASMKQSERPSGRNCQNKKAHRDELWVCQVKKYSIDRSEDKIKRKSQHKAKIQAKIDAEKRNIEDQSRDPSPTRISGK